MNPHAWLADAERVWPERLSLPDELDGADRLTLAEARSRLKALGRIVDELKRLVDRELAPKLAGGALRYGDEILTMSGKGKTTVVDSDGWWRIIAQTLSTISVEDGAGLLDALYPADKVRVSAIPQLARMTGYSEAALRSTFIDSGDPSSPIATLPRARWYKWHRRLADGQFSGEKVPTKEDIPEAPT